MNYKDVGLRYALGTKAILGKNLLQRIQRQGTEAALEFCNEKALALTDSMATRYNAQIQRVSDKPRNPNNQANTTELLHINSFETVIASGATVTPILNKQNEKIHFYYPITTNTMCLQCHGEPTKNIHPDILKILAALYPEDKATGYGINEVRGIWSIHFDAEND